MTVSLEFRRAVEEVIRSFPTSVGLWGGAIASANDLTLPPSAVGWTVTGVVPINRISSVGWQDGKMIVLIFTGGAITIKHNQAAGGDFLPMELSGNIDFAAANLASLTLVKTPTSWWEMGRKL